MKQYDVKISRMALSDMEQIYSYIADRLLESDTAMRQYDRIAEAIQSLNILPERCALGKASRSAPKGCGRCWWTTTRCSTLWARMRCQWLVCCTVPPTLCAACGE